MTEKYLEISGNKICYETSGHGVPLLMIHGVTDCKESFNTDLPSLEKKFTVIRYDLRGHGNSTHPKEEFTLEDHISDALSLIDKLGLDKFFLYGGSLGSYIAEGIAIRIPQKVKKLILNVSASHNPDSALAATVKNATLPANLKERRAWWIRRLVNDSSKVPVVMASGFQFNNLNSEDEYRALKSITAFDFRDDLSKIIAPTLITSGEKDPVNPAPKGKLISQKVKNSKFVSFNSGHLLRLENNTEYDRLIIDFLTENNKTSELL